MKRVVLTFVLMDPPFESARTTTAMRLIDVAARRGYVINVFAYEGAVCLPLAKQTRHPDALRGRAADNEDHPLTREWVQDLIIEAAKNGGELRWINCGICCDERGAVDMIRGVERGSSVDLWSMARTSENSLVIGTK